MKASILVLLVLVTIHSATATSRSIRDNSTLISNGMDQKGQSNILQLGLKSTNVTCEPTYGFLPCTTEVWGQLFLIVVYEYLLSLSSDYITSGSNLFFQIFGTGIFGASLFHILAIFPQLLLVLGKLLSSNTTFLFSSLDKHTSTLTLAHYAYFKMT